MLLLLQGPFVGFIYNFPRIDVITGALLLIFVSIKFKTIIIDEKIIIIFILYTVISVLQGFFWGFDAFSLLTSFLAGFLAPFYIFVLYKNKFFYVFEKVIYVLTIIALTIWLCHQFIPVFKIRIEYLLDIMNSHNPQVRHYGIIYTYWSQLDQNFGFSRNAGFSWEPGAFAVLIIYGIVINYVHNISLFSIKNIPYYAALISTFSTAGYISLGILTLLTVKQKKNQIFGYLIFPILIYFAIKTYSNADFLQQKVESQINEQTQEKLESESNGRILGARKSLYVFALHPLIGRGLLSITKPEDISDAEFADYGWLSYVSRFGFILAFVFMFFFIRGIYKFVRSGGYGIYEFVIITIAIMINLSSQVGIGSFYFMIFFFIGLYGYNYQRIMLNKKYSTN